MWYKAKNQIPPARCVVLCVISPHYLPLTQFTNMFNTFFSFSIVMNGHFIEGAIRCCLMPYQQNSMHEAKKVIAEKVAECSNYRCDEWVFWYIQSSIHFVLFKCYFRVFVNGQDVDKPTTVGLSSKQSDSMTEAIKAVHEAIKDKHQYRVDQ